MAEIIETIKKNRQQYTHELQDLAGSWRHPAPREIQSQLWYLEGKISALNSLIADLTGEIHRD